MITETSISKERLQMYSIVKILSLTLMLQGIAKATSLDVNLAAMSLESKTSSGLLISKIEKKEPIQWEDLHNIVQDSPSQFLSDFDVIVEQKDGINCFVDAFHLQSFQQTLAKLGSPSDQSTTPVLLTTGWALYLTKQFDEAIKLAYKVLQRDSEGQEWSTIAANIAIWSYKSRALSAKIPGDLLFAAHLCERSEQSEMASDAYHLAGGEYRKKAQATVDNELSWRLAAEAFEKAEKLTADEHKKAERKALAKDCYREFAKEITVPFLDLETRQYRPTFMGLKAAAKAHTTVGEDNEAKKTYRQIISSLSSVKQNIPIHAFFALADAYEGLGRNDEALTHYQKAALVYTQNQHLLQSPPELEIAAQALKKANQNDKAREFFIKAAAGFEQLATVATNQKKPSWGLWNQAAEAYETLGMKKQAQTAKDRAALQYVLENPMTVSSSSSSSISTKEAE